MALFRVIRVIDADTIQVYPNWLWNGQQGNIVRVYGYSSPTDPHVQASARGKLNNILQNQLVELKNPFIAPSNNVIAQPQLVCRVFRNTVDVSRYFPELNNF